MSGEQISPPAQVHIEAPAHIEGAYLPVHAAVMAGNLAVYHEGMADQASENRDFANHLAEEKVRDPRAAHISVFARGLYKKGIARAQLTEWLDETGTSLPIHSGLAFGQNMRMHNRERNSAEQTLTANLEIVRESFRDLDPSKFQKFDAHFVGDDVPPIFRHWKQSAEAVAQKSLSWAEWIGGHAVDEHESGAAADAQLLNVLQWSADKFQRQNNDPAFQEKIAQYAERFTASLEQLAKDKVLPPFFLDRLHDRGVGEVLKGDAFDVVLLRAQGYFQSQENRQFIVLDNTSFEIFSHELFHRLGGFGETAVDEAATENKTLELRRADAALRGENAKWLTSGMYVDERTMLGMLQNLADMNLYEVAGFEEGQDRAENSRRLRSEFAKRTGLDVIGLVELAYDNPARFASPDSKPLDAARCAFMCAREIWEQVHAIRSQSEAPDAEPGFEAVAAIVQDARAAILAAGAGALR